MTDRVGRVTGVTGVARRRVGGLAGWLPLFGVDEVDGVVA